jgi:hypothetical protein
MDSILPSEPLYRSFRARATSLVLLLMFAVVLVTAQKQSSGPRAVAVVQAGPQGPRRLIPIAIRVEGRFYDASIYRASPLPMALEPGTVYEVLQTGDSLGLFTIRIPAQTSNGNWSATGQWLDKHALEAAKAKTAAIVAPQAQKPTAEERPVLRKSPRKDPNAASPPSTPPANAPNTAPPPTASSGNNPPAVEGAPEARSQGSRSVAGAPAATPSPGGTSGSEDQAPDRPVLRRGKPEEESTGGSKSSAAASADRQSPGTRSKSAAPARLIPAISDAAGPEPRPYYFVPRPGEEAEFQKKVTQMAQDVVAKYEKARRPSFAAAQITAQDFRTFDLDASNQPVFVLTAAARILDRASGRPSGRSRSTSAGDAPSAPDAMLTVVAHEDVYGELQPMFASVTDAQHLDEFPRLQLVDAVDADGDGHGELLFQETGDNGSGWIIYKPGPDKMAPLFDSLSPQ